jgi:hypothetical protein
MNIKVYDCIMFNGEWDMLEIRLHTHDAHVDHFVIVESNQTFTGVPKSTQFDIGHPVVQPFSHKIRYVLVSDMPQSSDPWQREYWQRDAISRALWDAQDADVVIISDCDEILNPACIWETKQDESHDYWGYHLPLYYCYMNNRCVGAHADKIWSVAIRFQLLHFNGAHFWRMHAGNVGPLVRSRVLINAGWHYSFMMPSEQIANKLRSFSHQELDIDKIVHNLQVLEQVAQNQDILGRSHVEWQIVPEQACDLPDYVKQNSHKFNKYMFKY